MKPKHTPGPWKVEQHGNKEFPTCTEFEIWNQNTHVTTIHEHVEDIRIDIANANLIAAAPELLEALEMARAIVACYPRNASDLARIDSAIAKARGES